MSALPMHRVGCDCPTCDTRQMVMVNTKAYWQWKRGEGHIQDLLPSLSRDDREALITGICPRCWDKMAEEEED